MRESAKHKGLSIKGRSEVKSFLNSPQCFFGVLIICAALFGMSAWTNKPNLINGTTQAQQQPLGGQSEATTKARSKKYIGRYQILANDPVRLDIELKGTPIPANTHLSNQEKNWLDGVTLTVTNISSKSIVCFSLELWFPDAKPTTGGIMAHILRYGSDPQLRRATDHQPPLKPGQETKFEISGKQYADMKRFLETKVRMEHMNSVQIHIGLVVFDDDTAWSTGSFMRRDPVKPGAWTDMK
jgi:hypothetical protein